MDAQELADQELIPAPHDGVALDRGVERWVGLLEGHSTEAEEDDRIRFREAQTRAGAIAARGRLIMENYFRRQVEYYQRRADYHAALGRKYVAAAARPCLPVAADPPIPK